MPNWRVPSTPEVGPCVGGRTLTPGAFGALVAITAAVAASCLTGCPGAPPPHSESTTPIPMHAAGKAKVVFLWPSDNCEPGGHYTIATSGGRFLGNVGRGTRLEVDLPEGAFTFFAWNHRREETSLTVSSANVAVMHAEVYADRTYFVRLAFGEWDEHGPRVRYGGDFRRRGTAYRVCVSADAALFALAPKSEDWASLHDWLDELTPVASRNPDGQAWLDAEPLMLPDHRALGERHWLRMTGEAQKIATLSARDGVRVEP